MFYPLKSRNDIINAPLPIQNIKKHRYRFKLIVLELDAPNSPIEYQVALLAFINCIIISTQCLQSRVRIRNEFIGEYL